MKRIILFSFLLVCLTASAQIPEDAIRYSWLTHNGTARNMATGGVMGSLGGDLTATFVNPAGLGFFKTNEVVFTPGFLMNRNKFNYRDSLSLSNKNGINFGPSGVILALTDKYETHQSAALAFAFNQTANFNNTYHFNAYNNYSSFSEQFAEELAYSHVPLNSILSTASPYPFTSSPAFYTYLVDTIRINDSTFHFKAAPEYVLDSGKALLQDMTKRTRGGMYELAAAYAHNFNDKWYFGAGIGIPFIFYESDVTFTERDSSAIHSKFTSFTFRDHFTTQGIGINARFGVIFRPKEYFRVGFAFQTPTFMTLRDKRSTSLETVLGSASGVYKVSSDSFNIGQPDSYNYQQFAPWKAVISTSYVFREVEDVKKQRGFISLDIEYVNHHGSKFKSDANEVTDQEKQYFKALTSVVKDQYKGAFNFRLGGEVKFNTIMARLGAAYYGNPYKSTYPVKGSKMLLSGGLGYRNKGFFVDLTYVHQITKDAEFPYRLQDRLNTYATRNITQGNVVATIGIKF